MIRLGIRQCAALMARQTRTSTQKGALKLSAQQPVMWEIVRKATFFNKLSSDEMWKSMTSVSNAGRKRGRARRAKRLPKPNLDKGQIIGVGKENIIWPGLNSPILQGSDVQVLQKLDPDPEFQAKKFANRSQILRRRSFKVHPLLRGWTSKSLCGRILPKIECQDAGIDTEDFLSTPIVVRNLCRMTGTLGRIRFASVTVISGNKKGILGLGTGRSVELPAAITAAQRRSLLKLYNYELIDPNTVNHDFFYQFGLSKVFVYKKPPGYGLVCHRVIAEICKLIGIKDLYAKVEGSTNALTVAKAFLLGLADQKTYQQIADETGLHVVETLKEKQFFPTVKASPKKELTPEEFKNFNMMPFRQFVMGGKLPLLRKSREPALVPSYLKHLRRTVYGRNHSEVKVKLLAEYGELRSHLAEVYPECRFLFKRKKEETEA